MQCVDDHPLDCSFCNVQADKVPEEQRAAAFGVFSGVCTAGFVVGTIATRFLSVSSTFQVHTRASVLVGSWVTPGSCVVS
jgi:hypothetical protein